MPFLLLPFRPASNLSAARTFIRNYFNPTEEKGGALEGDRLEQELRLTEPLVRFLKKLEGSADLRRFYVVL